MEEVTSALPGYPWPDSADYEKGRTEGTSLGSLGGTEGRFPEAFPVHHCPTLLETVTLGRWALEHPLP